MTPGTVVEVRAQEWGHVAIFRSPEGVVTGCRLASPLEVSLYETVAELREEVAAQGVEIERLNGLVAQLNRVIDRQNGPSLLSPSTS